MFRQDTRLHGMEAPSRVNRRRCRSSASRGIRSNKLQLDLGSRRELRLGDRSTGDVWLVDNKGLRAILDARHDTL